MLGVKNRGVQSPTNQHTQIELDNARAGKIYQDAEWVDCEDCQTVRLSDCQTVYAALTATTASMLLK